MLTNQYREHMVKLFLNPHFRSAIIQYMAKEGLDKEYAVLKLLTKQLYQEQLINRETYETYLFRYSRKLMDLPVKLTPQELAEREQQDEQSKRFSWIIAHWRNYTRTQKREYVLEASGYVGKVANAAMVVDLGAKENVRVSPKEIVSTEQRGNQK